MIVINVAFDLFIIIKLFFFFFFFFNEEARCRIEDIKKKTMRDYFMLSKLENLTRNELVNHCLKRRDHNLPVRCSLRSYRL